MNNEDLEKLINSGRNMSYKEREIAILNPQTHLYTIMEIISSQSKQLEIKKLLIENPIRIKELIEFFDSDEKKDVWEDYVSSEDREQSESDYFNLTYLLLNRYLPLIRERNKPKLELLKDPDITIEELENLSEDKSHGIRDHVAAHPKTPIHILKKLLNDKEAIVRVALATNQNITIDIYEKLLKDESETVRSVAKDTHNF